MASWTKKLSVDTRYSITLSVSETSTSIEDNTSVVSYTLTATKSGGSGYYTSNKTNPVKVTINGKEVVNKKIAYDFTGSTPKTITLASGTVRDIKHETDGTKTIVCSGYFKDAENSLGNATASGNLKLTDLHKPPEIEVSSITELNTTLTGYGVSNDTFVDIVSRKQFVVNATPYDNATITDIGVYTGTKRQDAYNTNPATIVIDMANSYFTKDETGTKAVVGYQATDNKNGSKITLETYDNYIPYFKPTVVASSFTTKRAGQLTGDITLSANGTYYKERIGSVSSGITIVPKVYYRYKMLTPTEGSYSSWEMIPDADVSKSNGNWSVSKKISSVFSPESSYVVEIYCTDNLIIANNQNANNTQITVLTYSSTVLVGEATWTEYKDRVDFKKITISKQPIIVIDDFTEYTGAVASGSNQELTFNITKSGYTPIGIVGVCASGSRSSYIHCYYFCVNSDGTSATIVLKNTHSSNPLIANDSEVKIYVAYIKS